MNATNACMLYLMACALQGTPPAETALSGVDLDGLRAAARRHSVAAMVCMALEHTRTFAAAPEQTRRAWRELRDKAVRKNLLLDAERRAILQELDAAGIWYLPLKGSILKDWYPQFGMREMSDNDILFDPAGRERVHEIFVQRGYRVENYKKGSVDVYEKAPVYNYEMHTALISSDRKALSDYYADVRARLLPVEGTACGLQFTPEDFYLYVLVHAYKHFSDGGTGVRTLADIYVVNRHLGGTLDRAYLAQELDRLGLAAYERSSRLLAERLFSAARPLADLPLTDAERRMLEYQLDSSTYGTIDHAVHNRLQQLDTGGGQPRPMARWRYALHRLFPGRAFCRDCYPLVYRHPWLLPAFWVWRIAVRLRVNGRALWYELMALLRADRDPEETEH